MRRRLRKFWPILGVLTFSLSTAWPLFVSGYFYHHDDLQVIRIFEMRKCLTDLQIPCRWVSDMGFGNGFPLFNYYSATPYYIGAIFSFIFGYVVSAKILFIIPIFLGGLGMFYLGRELFGKYGGLVAAALYIFVPFRALDLYVRGAVAESFAISVFPLILYFALKRNFVGLTGSLFLLLTSHNIMSLFFVPVFLVWALIVGARKNIKFFLSSLILSVGLSAFFIIPAYFEKNLVQVDSLTTGYFDFRNHFATVRQLFLDRKWGYGFSLPGPNDGLSLQIGWPHWWIAVLSLIGLIVLKRRKNLVLSAFLILIFALSVLMTHNRSAPLWEAFSILKYAQFPWRFLGITAVSTSLLGGLLVSLLKKESRLAFSILIIILTVFLNFSYFKPAVFYRGMSDAQKLSGEEWLRQSAGGIMDYLPKGATEPKEPAPNMPIVRKGQSRIFGFSKRSNSWEFRAVVAASSTVEIPVFDFPGWEVYSGNKLYPHKSGVIGRITVDIEPGEYKISGKLKNTPLRNIANAVSLISFLSLAAFISYGKTRKIYSKS